MVPKILVVRAVYDAVRPEAFFASLALTRAISKGETDGRYKTRDMVIGPRTPMFEAQNEPVRVAFSHGATHLFVVDDDMVTPADALDKLLEVDKPIVSGLFHNKDGMPCVFQEGRAGGHFHWMDHPTSGCHECAAVGTATTLIQMDVFKRLSYPWFYNDRTPLSMDVHFCRDARASGSSVWCLFDLKVKQIVGNTVL